MNVQFGTHELELGGKYIDTDLRDSNDILNDVPALRQRMNDDGYLLLRGLYDREQVLAARRAMLEQVAAEGVLDPQAPLMDAVAGPDRASGRMRSELAAIPEFRAVVESSQIMGFFEHFLGGPVRTFDYKWIRLVSPGSATGAHYDVVYMGRGTTNLYTAWTPFGDLPLEMGALAICKGSHRFDKIKQTYGQMDVDRDLVTGWFSNDPCEIVNKFGGKWSTSAFRAGDVLIFGMYTMHASLKNVTNRFRLTSDTRYQLACEPVDERWIGEKPMAHYAWNQPGAKQVTMEEARARWDV